MAIATNNSHLHMALSPQISQGFAILRQLIAVIPGKDAQIGCVDYAVSVEIAPGVETRVAGRLSVRRA